MKCISEELIQKYIDKEATVAEVTYINNHISGCTDCSQKIGKHQESANNIKRLIGLLDEKEIDIPGFKIPDPQKNILPSKLKIFMYSAVAACVLIFLLILSREQKDDIGIIYSYDLESEFNANLPVSEQDMEIQIMDSEGNLLTY